MAEILLIEAFYGGSHKQLIDLLCTLPNYELFTLPAKKWHWRARTSALYFSQTIPSPHNYRVLFTSSVLNLTELVALRPDLASLKKILYFHENQLVYPVRKQQERDFQYGYNQILSCLVADEVIFNSHYNKESFLSNIQSFMKLIPDHRPKGIVDAIRPKCRVLYFPLCFPQVSDSCTKLIQSPGNQTVTSLNDHSKVTTSLNDDCQVTTSLNDHSKVTISLNNDSQVTSLNGDSQVTTSLNDDSQVMTFFNNTSQTLTLLNDDSHVTSLNDDGQTLTLLNNDRQKLTPGTIVDTDSSENVRTNILICDTAFNVDNKLLTCKTGGSGSSSVLISEMGSSDNSTILTSGSALNDKSLTSNTALNKGSEILTSNVALNENNRPVTVNIDSDDEPEADYQNDSSILHIVWAHRWEHDKDPTTLFNVLYRLQDEGYKFTVSVLGECFTQVPDVFMEAKKRLSSHILNWGYQKRDDYYSVLHHADVSVSTALHEFFGVAMLESVSLGCYPLCPDRLVYPEIFPAECLYRTTNQLHKKLRTFCVRPHLTRRARPIISLDRFSWKHFRKKYEELLT